MSPWQDQILQMLERYDGFEIETTNGSLLVNCENEASFEVSIQSTGGSFQVNFGGWHEHFSDQEEALNCFAFGLSTNCRLKVVKRGKMECAWTVQSFDGGEWIDDSTTGLLVFPFWYSKTVEHRQNVVNPR